MDDFALSRRDFLERTAYAAGLAGMASLPPSVLLAEAADAAARRNRLPSPRNMELDHIVVLMMENRSFDHYFGWLSDVADGVQHQTFADPEGQQHDTRHFTQLGLSGGAEYKGCGYGDPGHGWDNGRAQLKNGFLAEGAGNDVFALCYFNENELPYIHPAARAYTLHDRFFCSLLTSTWPNRYYKWSAQSGGIMTNIPEPPSGNSWETIFDRAISKGVTARYYHVDLPFSATFGARASAWTHPISEYYSDCAAGNLAKHHLRRPGLRAGVLRRPLDRRASSRRRAPGPGLHGRRRERVHPLAALPQGRAVHHLRRVGWLLRPRAPAASGR